MAKMDLELKSLEDLPDEILLKILGKVNIRDLIRCSFVNNKIRKIAHDKSLWEKMNLESNVDFPAELLSKLIEKGCEYLSIFGWFGPQTFGNLFSFFNIHISSHLDLFSFFNIHISIRFIISGVNGNAIEKNSKLKYLSFRVSEWVPSGLPEFAASCHALEKLSVVCNDIDQSAFDQVFACIIQNCSTLRVLCIKNCQLMSYESMRLILTNCQGLTDLNISDTSISQETMDLLCANLTIGIEKLDIAGQPTFGDDQLKTLLTRCKTLTELAFDDTFVTDESVDTILQNLSQTLTKLQVSYSDFSFPNLLKIGAMPNLKILRVCGLPTEPRLPKNKTEELIKLLPHLKSSFERKEGCRKLEVYLYTRPRLCVCDCLCIAHPYQSCVHWRNGFWEIEAKLRYY